MADSDHDLSQLQAMQDDEEEMTLLDFLLILAKQKTLLLGLPLGTAALATVVSLVLPIEFTATTRIMPPQQSQSNTMAILGHLGGLGSVSGTALGIKNPSDIFVSMLKSRTVADSLIDRFNLMAVYDKQYKVDARKKLERNVLIAAGKESVINIEVTDRDSRRAADLANGYVEELEKLTRNLAIGEAAQRRLFFEKQLREAKQHLAEAELAMKKFKQAAGLISPEGQTQLTVTAAANIRAQITAKEVQLSAMRAFGTESNPEIVRGQQEVAGLRMQLAKLEKQGTVNKGDVLVSLGQASETGLEYIQKFRDVKYFDTLSELLAKQFEIAKIDEAKDATLIQVIDVALPPEKPSKPNHFLIVSVAAVAAGVVAVLAALLREALHRASRRSKFHQQGDESRDRSRLTTTTRDS